MKTLDDIIRYSVMERLDIFKGNQTQAAKSLRMSRSCFLKYLKQAIMLNVIIDTYDDLLLHSKLDSVMFVSDE